MVKALDNYEKKKTVILEKASELFFLGGYSGTSMDQISAAAGVTKQTVYRYFPSKSALFSAVLDSMSPEGRSYIFGNGNLLSELTAFAQHFVTIHMEKRRLDFHRLLISESARGSEVSGIFKRIAEERAKPLKDFFRAKLSSPDPGKDAEIFIATLLSIRHNVILGLCPAPSADEIKKHAEYCAELLLSARKPI